MKVLSWLDFSDLVQLEINDDNLYRLCYTSRHTSGEDTGDPSDWLDSVETDPTLNTFSAGSDCLSQNESLIRSLRADIEALKVEIETQVSNATFYIQYTYT